MKKILVINPGAGSTKIALFNDEKKVLYREIRYTPSLKGSALEQFRDRLKDVRDFLEEEGIDELDAVAGRGGALKPLESGVYPVDEYMVKEIKEGNVQADHPSNLGALLAYEVAKIFKTQAFIVDPVSVDEMTEEARLSGIPELERKSLSHALNIKFVARKVAQLMEKSLEETNLVVAHLGTGISIASIRRGRMIDVNNANDGGPFSSQRAGSLPTTGLIKLCFSGKYSESELLSYVTKGAGLLAYLGTDDLEEIERRINSGDEEAERVWKALVHQIVKEVGAMAAVLSGDVDAIVITGGMARSSKLVSDLRNKLLWIAPIYVFPGEMEMEALASGVLRVLRGEEKPKGYIPAPNEDPSYK
jgi:butyrate kinase